MSVQAVLFDLDNTLTDRRESIANYARQFAIDFADQLEPIAPNELERLIWLGDGGGYRPKADMFAELADNLPWRVPLTPAAIAEHWYALSPLCMQPRVGLFETLYTLKQQGIRIGIITNGQMDVQQATIGGLCLGGLMDVVIISETVGIKKPAPEIFHMALDELDVSAATSWFVGDHALNDVIGSSAAGLTGVWLNVDGEWPSTHPEPLFEIRTLAELIALLPS
jgi:putative hydrolase of the HAD superfamily